jgi:hypothetical protein
LGEVPLTISISGLVKRGDIYIDMSPVKCANTVREKGFVFIVVCNTRRGGSIDCRKLNNFLVEEENRL